MGINFIAFDTDRTRISFNGLEVPIRISIPGEWEYGLDLNVMSTAALFYLFDNAASNVHRIGDMITGMMTIPEARRTIMVCRARFDLYSVRAIQQAERFKPGAFTGALFVNVTEPAPFGTDELRDRLDRFADFVEAASVCGANAIMWS